LQSFGGIRKYLFKPISFYKDMPDDLSLIGLEWTFAFGIDDDRQIGGITIAASGDGTTEKLENIVFFPSLDSAERIRLFMADGICFPAGLTRFLAEGIEIA
jgi:hypothetical protein